MKAKMKIGYFEHWHQPPYKFVDFLKEEGIEPEKIDFSRRGYLEGFDVAIIEQNGFNDYIENDEIYIQDWVKRGGILLFMHQDYKRHAPYFFPRELGHTQLIHRYIETINGGHSAFSSDRSVYMSYMMPWIEDSGRRLFSEPEVITPDEMIGWEIGVNSFGITRGWSVKPGTVFENGSDSDPCEYVRTAALSCYLANPAWEIIGSFMDPSVKDGALIMRGRYGSGMYFMNQLLFPETKSSGAERCFAFWRKYIKNLLSYFERFKSGESEAFKASESTLPPKKNYKLAIHMHSLDWYGCDSAPGTINAMMRYMNYDICSLGVKDNAPYDGKLDTKKYSDDKVLFLDGQEYHPFNWNDKYDHLSHNTYHMLAMGIDPDAYTPKYTCSLFSDAEIAEYLKEAVDYVHEHGGAVCATHPNVDYWTEYDFDAVDKEPLRTLSGTDVESYWLSGGRIAIMNSVDLFGFRRILDNPAVNFIYLSGEAPTRDSVVKAIRAGHTVAAAGFDEADITLSGYLPGDTVTSPEAKNGVIALSAATRDGYIDRIRVFSDDRIIYSESGIAETEIKREIALLGLDVGKYIRVELEGEHEGRIAASTPFYIVDENEKIDAAADAVLSEYKDAFLELAK